MNLIEEKKEKKNWNKSVKSLKKFKTRHVQDSFEIYFT